MRPNLYKDLLASLFIFLFLYTAASKLLAIASFQRTLERSPLIGAGSQLVSWIVPGVEVVLSVLLFLPASRRMALLLTLLLLTGFTLYIGYMLLFSSELPCACGGVLPSLDGTEHLWFNIFLVVLAGAGIHLHRPKYLLQ